MAENFGAVAALQRGIARGVGGVAITGIAADVRTGAGAVFGVGVGVIVSGVVDKMGICNAARVWDLVGRAMMKLSEIRSTRHCKTKL